MRTKTEAAKILLDNGWSIEDVFRVLELDTPRWTWNSPSVTWPTSTGTIHFKDITLDDVENQGMHTYEFNDREKMKKEIEDYLHSK